VSDIEEGYKEAKRKKKICSFQFALFHAVNQPVESGPLHISLVRASNLPL
jgi:hypothetical protein